MLRPRDRFLHRLEQSWRMILASLALAAVAAATFAFYGVPWTAGWLARHTPQSVARLTTQQTMYALEGRILKPSRLVPGLQSATQDMFRDIARQAPRGEKGYRLLLRDAPLVGPNAFALPDGTIVITDQLVRLSKNHEEVTGVIIHEMSHVDHAHGLQSVYQAALVPAAIAFITGDVSQAAQFAAVLPGILLQSAYSRAFEQQADADAAELMRRRGEDPAQLGAFLERIEARLCGKGACGPSWLGSHPDSSERAARLRGR
jgi:Zn-dependent protease with chaperone function